MSELKFKNNEEYWVKKLLGFKKLSDLPRITNEQKLNVSVDKAVRHLTADKSSGLLALCNEDDLNIFSFILTAVSVVLNSYEQANRITLLTPSVKEADVATSGSCQYLQFEIDQEQNFKTVFLSLQDLVFDSIAHQEYNPENVKNKLKANYVELSNAGIAIQYDALHNDFSIDDLSAKIKIVTIDNCFHFHFEYNPEIYEKYIAESFLQSIVTCLSAIIEDTGEKLSSYPLIDETEQLKVLTEFNLPSVAVDNGETLVQIFAKIVEQYPSSTAIQCDDVSISYAELDKRSSALASSLAAHENFKKGEFVGLLLDRSEWIVIGIIGVLKAGGVYLPMDPSNPAERINYIINDSGIKILLVDKIAKINIPDAVQLLDIKDKSENNIGSLNDFAPKADSGAYIIYTSGTTGLPKGCLISHRNVVSLFKNTADLFEFSHSDVWPMAHSFNFDFSVWEIFGALLHGGKLVIFSKDDIKDPADFIKKMEKHKITVLNQTPAAFYNLINYGLLPEDKAWSSHLRYVIFGGDRLDTSRLKDWIKFQPLDKTRLINMYGITETTVHATFHRIAEYEMESSNSNIGKGFPGVALFLLDNYKRIVPAGAMGEIYVCGDGVSSGYLNKAELTKERFIKNPFKQESVVYKSGDIGIRNAEGDILYIGRNDDQVQIRGFRVELGEIKNSILSDKKIKDALVVLHTTADDEKELIAYCILSEEFDLQELRKALAAKLPDYMVPNHFIEMTSFPLTTNGKIDKKIFPLPGDDFANGGMMLPPASDLEKILVIIWKAVLKRHSVGISDNFFALGGDSIKAIRLVSALNKKLNTKVAVKDIYIHQDIAAIAAFISENGMSLNDPIALLVAEEMQKDKQKILESENLVAKLPSDMEDLYPMSDIEKGMLFHSLLQPEAGIYHDQMYYQFIDNAFEMEIFKKAFTLLVDKHEILRTSFHITDFDHPIQVVHSPSQNITIGYEDVSELSKEEKNNYLANFSKEDLKHPFAPAVNGLWRLTVFKLSSQNYGMFWVCHHAVLDGWSNASLISELTTAYFKLKEDPLYKPQHLKATYKDYVIDQVKVKQNSDVIKFWKSELSGYQRTPLPFSKSIGQKQNLTISNYQFKIDSALVKKLTLWGEQNDITMKDICLSAFLFLVHTTTNATNLTVGTVTSGRPEIEDGDKIIGCFLNTIPFRYTIEREMFSGDFVKAVKNKSRRLKSYDKLSLVEILKLAGDASSEQSPLFDLYFNYTDFHIHEDTKEEVISGEDSEIETRIVTNTVFDFIVYRNIEELGVHLLYSPELYSQNELLRLEKFYKYILETIAIGDNSILDTFLLMDESEKKLLENVNDTFVDIPIDTTIIDLYKQTVKERSTFPAVLHENKTTTYGELDEKANRIANYLVEQCSIVKGDVVGVFVGRSTDMVASMIGIFKSGGVYLAIPDDIPHERMLFMLSDSKARFLIIKNDSIDFSGKIVDLNLIDKDLSSIEPDIQVVNSDHAYIVYTSGSTGLPKGVLQHHLCLTNLMIWQEKDLGRNLNILQYAYMGADVSVQDIVFSFISGGTICMIEEENRRDISSLSKYIVEKGVEVVCLQPSVLNLIFEVHFETFSQGHKLKHLISTGEQLKVSRGLSAFLKENPAVMLHNHYGPSETHVVTRYKTNWKKDLQEASPIGTPLSNTYIRILGSYLQLLPYGVIGELYLGGYNVGVGYLNLPELTSERFIKDPYSKTKTLYKAGDIGKWMKDGNLEFLGRIDDQVKIRGYRIELGEIEKNLQTNENIQTAVVVAFEDQSGSKYLAAYFTSRMNLDTEGIKEYLKKTLPDYMIPAHIIQIDSIPLTANSKIDKRALPDPKKRQADQTIFKSPSNSTEEKLKEIWLIVLGIEDIGVDNNFFEFGGDSIKVIRLFGKIKKELFENVQIADLFNYDTINKFSEHIIKVENLNAPKLSYNEIEI